MKLKVSDTIQKRLDDLIVELRKAHGDDLSAVLVHGSAARGGWRDGSDVDVVIVLKKAPRAALETSSNALQIARLQSRIEAMILVEDEIPRAADVFPIFYDEIKRCHVLLHGRDAFADLKIEAHHIRLRIEQELREAQIRMRRAVVDAQGGKEGFRGALVRKIKQVRSPLRALLERKGITVEDDLPSVLKVSGQTFKVDVNALARVDEDPAAAHDALVELLDRAIRDVDAMEGA